MGLESKVVEDVREEPAVDREKVRDFICYHLDSIFDRTSSIKIWITLHNPHYNMFALFFFFFSFSNFSLTVDLSSTIASVLQYKR